MSNKPKNATAEKIRGLLDSGQNIFRKRTVSQLLMAYDEQVDEINAMKSAAPLCCNCGAVMAWKFNAWTCSEPENHE